MWDRLSESFADEVDSDKNKSDVKHEGITKSNSKNLLTTIGSNCPLLNGMPSIGMEEWDEVFTAKDLREIPVAKTNCIPIIPKRYRKLIENSTYRPNILKKNVDSESDNDKKIMTLNDHLKRFGLLEPENDLCKDICKESNRKSTKFRNVSKRSSKASEMKEKEKEIKSVLWRPNLIQHTFSHEDNPINNPRMQRSIEGHRHLHNQSLSASQNKATLNLKSRLAYDGNRPPIESLIEKLIKDPVKFQLPERKSPFNSKK